MLIRFSVRNNKKRTAVDMDISWCVFHGYKVLFILLTSAAAECSILRGPDNVVGIVDGDVTLSCRTTASQKVEWTFRQFGKSVAVDESKFPGHHSISSRTRGYHSLTLQDLTFTNTGRYVCRVVGISEGAVDAAAAFVVVVADPPRCTNNITGRLAYNDNSVSLECSVTFFGQHSLTLEWLAPDGEVIDQKHYRSGDLPYVARLPLSVKAETVRGYNLSTLDYKCRASFSNGTTAFVDEASNPPEFRRNTCSAPLSALSVSPTDACTHAEPSASLKTFVLAVVVLSVISLTNIVFCVYRSRESLLRRYQQIAGRSSKKRLLSGLAGRERSDCEVASDIRTFVDQQPSNSPMNEDVVWPDGNGTRLDSPPEPQSSQRCLVLLHEDADTVLRVPPVSDINRQESAVESSDSANTKAYVEESDDVGSPDEESTVRPDISNSAYLGLTHGADAGPNDTDSIELHSLHSYDEADSEDQLD